MQQMDGGITFLTLWYSLNSSGKRKMTQSMALLVCTGRYDQANIIHIELTADCAGAQPSHPAVSCRAWLPGRLSI